MSDPANRCSQGCLAGSDGGDDADGGAGDPLSLRARRDAAAGKWCMWQDACFTGVECCWLSIGV